MKSFMFLTTVLAFFICNTGCDSLENPDGVEEDEVLLLEVGELSRREADSMLVADVVARVPKAAGKVDISFTSSKGAFARSASEAIDVFADSVDGDYRYARSVLQLSLSAVPHEVYVTAEVGGQRRRARVYTAE